MSVLRYFQCFPARGDHGAITESAFREDPTTSRLNGCCIIVMLTLLDVFSSDEKLRDDDWTFL